MTLSPALRAFALLAHVTFSVGWLGAVIAFLGLAVIGLIDRDAQTVRGAYLVMEPAAWFVLVPLAFASLLTGIVQSLGTPWGLFRHYWVLVKFLLNVLSIIVLLTYMATFRQMAGVAADPGADLGLVRNPSPALHAALALIVLLTATALAVYKPPGMTPYGRRKRREPRESDDEPSVRRDRGSRSGTPVWLYVSGMVAIALIFLAVLLHLSGGGSARH